MLRQAFVMKLKPGALATYTNQHDHLWPKLAAEIRACGIKKIATFEDDPYLFLYSEVEDEGAWARLWDSEIHRAWGEVMEPLMEFGPDGKVDARFVKQVFNFDA
jgi:L-rhamnose mutarotase